MGAMPEERRQRSSNNVANDGWRVDDPLFLRELLHSTFTALSDPNTPRLPRGSTSNCGVPYPLQLLQKGMGVRGSAGPWSAKDTHPSQTRRRRHPRSFLPGVNRNVVSGSIAGFDSPRAIRRRFRSRCHPPGRNSSGQRQPRSFH